MHGDQGGMCISRKLGGAVTRGQAELTQLRVKAPILLGKNYFSFGATLTALTRPFMNSPDGASVCNVLLSLCCTYWCISRPQTPSPS